MLSLSRVGGLTGMRKLCKQPNPQSEMKVSLKSLSWASGDIPKDHRPEVSSSPYKRVKAESKGSGVYVCADLYET